MSLILSQQLRNMFFLVEKSPDTLFKARLLPQICCDGIIKWVYRVSFKQHQQSLEWLQLLYCLSGGHVYRPNTACWHTQSIAADKSCVHRPLVWKRVLPSGVAHVNYFKPPPIRSTLWLFTKSYIMEFFRFIMLDSWMLSAGWIFSGSAQYLNDLSSNSSLQSRTENVLHSEGTWSCKSTQFILFFLILLEVCDCTAFRMKKVSLDESLSFLQVCREYQRGNCSRGENDCRFAHPADSTMIDTNDNTVTVCMDYIKGRCSREKCKYFHPPAHLQAKIKAAQHQVNQATAAAAMVSSPDEHTHVQSHAYRLRSRFWESFPEL